MLLMGDSKSGKTGSLAPLVGPDLDFNLRILDMDNGLDPLKAIIESDYPDRLDRVDYRTIRDKRKATPLGSVIDGPPRAFITALKMLDHWRYDDVDLGVPSEWGPSCILVIDSLTFLSDAAYDWREPLTPRGKGGDYDQRAVYGGAQDAIEQVLALVTSESFRTNVIVISHIKYIERQDRTIKGYPTAVGAALSPQIPRYFNTVALFETGPGGKRSLKTQSTALIDLANPKAFEMAPSYPIETGMGDFFKILRGTPHTKPQPKLRKI